MSRFIIRFFATNLAVETEIFKTATILYLQFQQLVQLQSDSLLNPERPTIPDSDD